MHNPSDKQTYSDSYAFLLSVILNIILFYEIMLIRSNEKII